MEVHGTDRQNTCAPTTQFKKKETSLCKETTETRRSAEQPAASVLPPQKKKERKRKLSNFENPQPTEGRNHGHEFCASHLLFFFLFQLNSKVCNRNQTHTYTKHLKPGSPLGAACERQPASPPLRPLVLTQGRCVETAFPSGEAAHLPYLHTHRALHTIHV